MSLSRTLAVVASTTLGLLVLSAAPALAASPASVGEFCLDVAAVPVGPVTVYPGGRYCVVTP